ncbi:hypothetical protein GCM10027443_01280 [Pontibacter brevis]
MKYWLLTTEYPPFFGGGISTYCFYTAKMLAENGHQVTVFINDSSISTLKVEQQPGIRVVRFNPTLSESSSFLGYSTCVSYEFAQIVKSFIEREGKPDIIESQEYLGIAYYLLQYKHLHYDWCKDIPVLITMHSPAFLYLEFNHVPLYTYPNFWIGEMERFCIKSADILISPSRYLVEEVSKRFSLEGQEIIVLPNPYRGDCRIQKRATDTEPGKIVFLGKLSVQKGSFELLRYFTELWDNGFSEPLNMIGAQDIVYHPEGKTMGDIIRKKYKGAIDRGLLHLEHKIDPSQLHKRLHDSKVVIVPSTVDNLPYVVMEMMSMGLIVLVSKQGGQTEIVDDGINGFVFDHTFPESFYSQLNRILELTPVQRLEISNNAIRKIKECFDPQSIYIEKVALLQSVIFSKTRSKQFPFCHHLVSTCKQETTDSKKADFLSIVIPYYNMGQYIEDTIESLTKVTHNNIEIIIVNDGTTDKASLVKLKELEGRPKTKIISTPNRGLAAARNLGASIATGKYLAFLDADDIVLPEYYSKAINVLQHQDNVSFVGCWTRYFEKSSDVWPTFTPEPPILMYHNLINSSSLVYKTEAYLTSGLNDENMPFQGLEDYDSVISLVSNGYRGVVLPEVLFHYRVRKTSMIRGVSKEKKLLLLNYITTKHRSLYTKFAYDLHNLQMSNGSGLFIDNPSLDYLTLSKFPFSRKISNKILLLIKRNRYARKIAYHVKQLY